MPFAGSWLRGTLGASGVALLVPGALTVGVSAAAIGGGLRGLGSLDQIVAGPKIRDAPRAIPMAHVRRPDGAGLVALPVVPAAPASSVLGPQPVGAAGSDAVSTVVELLAPK